jgi:N utilization substance protein B
MTCVDKREWCEDKIKSHLQNWDMDRVALLDKLVLVMGICEIYFLDDVPPKVTISEAIEIAKKFSTEESSSFVNGILDAVYKDAKAEKTIVAD